MLMQICSGIFLRYGLARIAVLTQPEVNKKSKYACVCVIVVCAGTVAPDDVRRNVMNAWKTGDEAFHKFLPERITSTRVDFFEKLTEIS